MDKVQKRKWVGNNTSPMNGRKSFGYLPKWVIVVCIWLFVILE